MVPLFLTEIMLDASTVSSALLLFLRPPIFYPFFLLGLLTSLPPYLELPQNLLRLCRKILLQLPKSQISKTFLHPGLQDHER